MSKIEGIYGILPADIALEDMLAKAEAALNGGLRILQLRDKQTPAYRRLSRARALRELTRRYSCTLIINDDAELALAADADGVHVGRGDCQDLQALRRRLGARMLGVSCQGDINFARQALAHGADYVSFGAVYTTQSKAATQVIGPEILQQARRRLPAVCLVAIGGINRANIAAVKQAGADAAAVIADLFGAADVEARARALVEAWKRG